MFLSNLALADCDPRFYIGGEISANHYQQHKFQDLRALGVRKSLFNKTAFGIGGFIGSRINECLGIEVGYTYLTGKRHRIANLVNVNTGVRFSFNTRIKSQNIYADVLGYIPVSDCVDLIGSLGIGRLHNKVTFGITSTDPRVRSLLHIKGKENKVGFRAV